MNIRLHYMRTIFKVAFFFLAGIFFCDYVMAKGGYPTLLPYTHPASLIAPGVVVVAAFIWIGFYTIMLGINHKWMRFSILAGCIAVLLVGAKMTTSVLAKNSEKRAYKVVSSFFTGNGSDFAITVDNSVKRSYHAFASSFDPTVVTLVFSYPPHGRYHFLIHPKDMEPFVLILWIEDSRGRIWITRVRVR